MKDQRGIIIRP